MREHTVWSQTFICYSRCLTHTSSFHGNGDHFLKTRLIISPIPGKLKNVRIMNYASKDLHKFWKWY